MRKNSVFRVIIAVLSTQVANAVFNLTDFIGNTFPLLAAAARWLGTKPATVMSGLWFGLLVGYCVWQHFRFQDLKFRQQTTEKFLFILAQYGDLTEPDGTASYVAAARRVLTVRQVNLLVGLGYLQTELRG